jgi:hypothetical protein
MSGLRTRAEGRVELRVPAGSKAKWVRAAERAGVSLPDWARRRLDDFADKELGIDEPPTPSAEDIEAALESAGSQKGSGLRARVHATRRIPWVNPR